MLWGEPSRARRRWPDSIDTDPGCNEKARNRATLEAQKFAQEADGLLHGCDCPPRAGDPDLHEFLVAVNLAVHDLGTSLHNGAEFIAAVRAKVPDATDAEILAAVRYGGALEVREIDQIDRYMTAQGEPNDEDDNEAGRYLLAAPYVAAAAALEEYIRVNRKGSSRPGPPWCGDHDLGEPSRARRRWA